MTGVYPTTLTYYDLLQEYPYSVIISHVVKESLYKQEWDVQLCLYPFNIFSTVCFMQYFVQKIV